MLRDALREIASEHIGRPSPRIEVIHRDMGERFRRNRHSSGIAVGFQLWFAQRRARALARCLPLRLSARACPAGILQVGSAGLDFQKGNLRPCRVRIGTVQGCRPAQDHWLHGFNYNVEESFEGDRYETLAICRTLAFARAVFKEAITEKPGGRFMIRTRVVKRHPEGN